MFRKKSRLDQVRDTVQDRASDLLDQASDAWNGQVAPALEDARKKAGPVIADARKKAGPVIADARKKAQPVLDDAQKRFKDDVVPAVASAVADARDKAQEKVGPYLEDARAEATRRGAATAAAVRGEVDAPKKKGGKLRKVLLAGGLLGLGAFVFTKLRGNDGADAWQSSYTPPAPPSPAPKPVPTETAATETAANKPPAPAKKKAAAKDDAGATPGEAASDEVAEDGPHAVTTPDEPATQVDVSGEPDPKP